MCEASEPIQLHRLLDNCIDWDMAKKETITYDSVIAVFSMGASRRFEYRDSTTDPKKNNTIWFNYCYALYKHEVSALHCTALHCIAHFMTMDDSAKVDDFHKSTSN